MPIQPGLFRGRNSKGQLENARQTYLGQLVSHGFLWHLLLEGKRTMCLRPRKRKLKRYGLLNHGPILTSVWVDNVGAPSISTLTNF